MENYIDMESLAVARYELGVKPSVSTGICGFLTVGYGKLDECGYWEYPLPFKYWDEKLQDLYWSTNQ